MCVVVWFLVVVYGGLDVVLGCEEEMRARVVRSSSVETTTSELEIPRELPTVEKAMKIFAGAFETAARAR